LTVILLLAVAVLLLLVLILLELVEVALILLVAILAVASGAVWFDFVSFFAIFTTLGFAVLAVAGLVVYKISRGESAPMKSAPHERAMNKGNGN
jgi:energy-coupling factor transporter transmembrane protein EcfT